MASAVTNHARRTAVKEGDWATGTQRARNQQHRIEADQRRKSWIRKRIKESLDNESEREVLELADLHKLNEAIRDIQVHSTSKILSGLVKLRKALSRYDAPFEDIIKRRAVTHLCELLYHHDDDIKAETSWCLINLSAATTEHARPVLKAVPTLITFLEAVDVRLNEHACWCLGNLAGEADEEFSKVLVGNGIALPLLKLIASLTQQAKTSTCYQVAWWCLGNLSRHLRFTPWASEYEATVLLLDATQSPDFTIQSEAWWTVSNAVVEQTQDCETLLQQGLLPVLATVIPSQYSVDHVLLPAVRTLGHLSAGPLLVTATPEVMSLLEVILQLLTRLEESAAMKEAAWTMNNLTALCMPACAHLLLMITTVAQKLLSSTLLEIQKEGVIALANVANLPDFATAIAQAPGIVNMMLDVLVVNDQDIRTAALLVIRNCPRTQGQHNTEVIRSQIEHVRSMIDLNKNSSIHTLILETLQSLTS